MYAITDFNTALGLLAKQYAASHYANAAAELTAIATLLSSDLTHHDQTIENPGASLRPSHITQTRFTNDVLLIVNQAKGGGVTPTAISNAITAGVSQYVPPSNTTAPAVTGTGTVGQTLTCTQGIWTNVPTSYVYQWQRNGGNISGAEASTHVLVAADSGTNVSCRVTATNAAGSASVSSNAIACA
jgi:hypothetical protein